MTFARTRHEARSLVILAVVCMTSLVLPLDFSGAAAATPAIAREIGGGGTSRAWIVNAFMVSFGSCVMAAGSLADELGRKRVFVIGVVAFVVTSVAITFAPGIGSLLALRVAQGVAAAATLSGGSAALAQEFEGEARARAFSLLGATFGVGLALGPSIGGALIRGLGWRSVFLAGAVVGAAALVVGVPRMRETRDPDARGVDWAGTATFTATLALFTTAFIQAPTWGWTSARSIVLACAAAVTSIAFVVIELRVSRPMLDLSLFRYPKFVGVQILPIATACSYVVLLVLLPLRFIGIEGQDEMHAGVRMVALSAPMLFVPVVASIGTRWISPAQLSALGLIVAAVALVWLGSVAPGASFAAIAPPMLLVGFGTSMPWAMMDGLSVSVVPKERAGMAAGIFGTTRVAGEGLVLAATRAALATMTSRALVRVAEIEPRSPSVLAEVGQRLVDGELGGAGVPQIRAIAAYGVAFQSVCVGLALVVVSAAGLVLLLARGATDATTRIRTPSRRRSSGW